MGTGAEADSEAGPDPRGWLIRRSRAHHTGGGAVSIPDPPHEEGEWNGGNRERGCWEKNSSLGDLLGKHPYTQRHESLRGVDASPQNTHMAALPRFNH